MQPLSSRPLSSPLPPKKRPMRFGATGAGFVGGLAGATDAVFKTINENRTNQMLLEDFAGFGLLRTWMDWRRGKMYGNDENNSTAAWERIARETASIITDNVLPGVVAAGLGKWLEGKQGLANQFVSQESLALFQGLAEKADSSEVFLEQISTALLESAKQEAGGLTGDAENKLRAAIISAWETGKDVAKANATGEKAVKAQAKASAAEKVSAAAKDLAISLKGEGSKSFQWTLKQAERHVPLALNEFCDDLSRFSAFVAEKKVPWKEGRLARAIGNTIQNESKRIGFAMPAAMVATFAIPFLISEGTRKFTGIDYYPGEIGLRQPNANPPAGSAEGLLNQPTKSFWQKHFPYLSSSLANGNMPPLLGALLPLPAALGIVNTYAIPKHPLNPKKWFTLDGKKIMSLLSFSKSWPHTTQQQMAALFAGLISSRLLNARSDNEYRERLIDSAAGWGFWILGTPLIKRAIATALDKTGKTALLENGAIRSREEIELFLKGPIKAATKNAHILIGAGSTIATMLVLGVLEPWLGIIWTRRNERKKQAKQQAQQNALQPKVTPQPMSQAMPLQSRAFAPYPVTWAGRAFPASVAYPLPPTMNQTPFAPLPRPVSPFSPTQFVPAQYGAQ